MAHDPYEKVSVELAQPQSFGGVQHKKGDSVEVYPNEARELAVAGKIVQGPEEYASETEEYGGYFDEYNSANVVPGPSVDELSNQETKDASELQESSVSTEDDEEDDLV